MTSVGAGGGGLIRIGLIETIRARGGRLPWLGRHLERLRASAAALGLAPPPSELDQLIRMAAGWGDRVVRVELRDGSAEIATRGISDERSLSVIVSHEIHEPYPHKTTQREPFGRALSRARRQGASDAILVTAAGVVAEGTAWNLFWWDNGALCTPAADLGILPGVGRQRVMELTQVREEQVPPAALKGHSLFLVNSVRGIVEIGAFEGFRVPADPRTAELSASFWPD
jgi:branched-subunit amino acid aminotransferase/4-amino-4-deoxychorismate lyase